MVDSTSEHTEGLNPVQTRLVKREDVIKIKEIMTQWFRHWKTGELLQDEVDEAIDNINKSIDNPDYARYIVIESVKDGVIGFAGLKSPIQEMKQFTTSPNSIELVNLFLDNKQRAKGYGKNLIDSVESHARAKGSDEIVLNSGPRYKDTAWGFYDSLPGYNRVGILKDFYGEGIEAPVWRKNLVE